MNNKAKATVFIIRRNKSKITFTTDLSNREGRWKRVKYKELQGSEKLYQKNNKLERKQNHTFTATPWIIIKRIQINKIFIVNVRKLVAVVNPSTIYHTKNDTNNSDCEPTRINHHIKPKDKVAFVTQQQRTRLTIKL